MIPMTDTLAFTPADGVMRAIRPSRKIVWAIIGVATAVWLYVGVVLVLVAHNSVMIPVWMLIGSFTLATAFLTVFVRRLGSATTLTPRFLLVAFVVGGLGAVIIGGTLDTITIARLGETGGLLLAGVVEEAAKAVLVVLICWRLPDKTVRNGLLVGGTVGLGFGAFEDLGYAIGPFLGAPFNDHEVAKSMLTQIVRVVTGPAGHPLWTALLAAAIFAAARNGRFRLTLGVVGAYLGVAFSHGMFDGGARGGGLALSVFGAEFGIIGTALGTLLSVGSVVVAIIVWRRVAKRAGSAYRAELATQAQNTSVPTPS
jgi:RsiW-degrading membrane proteinase PrsW (M82 family)